MIEVKGFDEVGVTLHVSPEAARLLALSCHDAMHECMEGCGNLADAVRRQGGDPRDIAMTYGLLEALFDATMCLTAVLGIPSKRVIDDHTVAEMREQLDPLPGGSLPAATA